MVEKNNKGKEKFKNLRKKAEKKLESNQSEELQPEDMSQEYLRRLVEELRTHQVELEMQNQQLLETQEKLEESKQKFSDLYDFAPIGYLTLDQDGKILEANLTAAKMLDTKRRSLIGASFYRYFATEDRDHLFLHLRKSFKISGNHTCELKLAFSDKNKPHLYIKLDTVCYLEGSENRFCRTTMTDITRQKRTESALHKSEAQLRRLSAKLLETQELEREQVAYDLHDDVCQMLVAGRLNAQNLLKKFPQNSPEYKALANLVDISQKAVTQIKKIVSGLRPTVLDGLGIIAAIGWLCNEYQKIEPGLTITRKIAVEEKEIPKSLRPVIFRILQEIMSNIANHSLADQAEIFLKKSKDFLELAVKDNGKGFEPGDFPLKSSHQRGVGITSMSERARSSGGFLEIHSSKTGGTAVVVRWPKENLTE